MFRFALINALAWNAFWEIYSRSALNVAHHVEDIMYAPNGGAQRAAIEAINDLERVCREHAAATAEKK